MTASEADVAALQSLDSAVQPHGVPADVTQSSSGTELLLNGDFASGAASWNVATGGGRPRDSYPAVGSMIGAIGALSAPIALPTDNSGLGARLCNYPGRLVETTPDGTIITSTNCLDRFSQNFQIPAGTTQLSFKTTAFADYAGCTTAKMLLRLKVNNSSPKLDVALSNSNLPSGEWQVFTQTLDVSSLNGQAAAGSLDVFGSVSPYCATQENVKLLISRIRILAS